MSKEIKFIKIVIIQIQIKQGFSKVTKMMIAMNIIACFVIKIYHKMWIMLKNRTKENYVNNL